MLRKLTLTALLGLTLLAPAAFATPLEVFADTTVADLQAQIEAGADPNEVDPAVGFAPIFQALARKNEAAAIYLVERGVSPNTHDRNGQTPMMWAVHGHASQNLMRRLLEAGAEVDGGDGNGVTPMIFAAGITSKERPNILEVVRLLLDAGADPNLADSSGYTPLMAAASGSDTPMVPALLIARGADVNAQNFQGMTALMLAVGNPSPLVFPQLLTDKLKPDLRAKDGKTALMYAVLLMKNPLYPMMLLEHKADPHIAEASGLRALDFARMNPAMARDANLLKRLR